VRILLVGNPAAGGGRAAARMREAAILLREGGAVVEMMESRGAGDVRARLGASVAGADRVAACGGDGLVSEAAGALAGSGMPLALLPAGRGNDLARALGIPFALRESVHLALSGRERAIDLGVASGRTFCTVAACGLDAEVSRAARTTRIPLPGLLGYALQALKQLVSLPSWRMRVDADGEIIEEDALLLAVANTPNYGGGFRIAPRAVPDDGLLDACLVRSVSRLRALALLPRIAAGRHEGLAEVRVLRARRFEIASVPELRIEADGEALAETPAVLEVRPRALMVVVPEA
jgi:diacylglycerol kinase (ATP)